MRVIFGISLKEIHTWQIDLSKPLPKSEHTKTKIYNVRRQRAEGGYFNK